MTDGNQDSLQASPSWIRVALPLAVVILVGLHWWRDDTLRRETEVASAMAARQWANPPVAFPLDTLSNAVYMPLAASPLSLFDSGDGPWTATSAWLQLGRLARSQDQLGYDYFPSGRHPDLDAASFLQFAIPALAIVVCWRIRQSGPPGQPISWANLILHLTEICGPAIAVGCLLSAALAWRTLGVDGAVRLMLLLACYLLYIVSAAGVCWLAFRPGRDLSIPVLLLCLFWLFNFTLARPATLNLASSLYPVPGLDTLARKIDFETRNGYNGVEPRRDRERRFISEALADYKVKSIEQMPVNLSAIMLQKEERHQREVFVRHLGDVRDQFARQERFEQFASLLFPFTAVQLTSSAFAATDFATERELLAQADLYWDRIVKKIYADVVQSSGTEGVKVARGPEYWGQIPPVRSTPPNPVHSLGSSLIPSAGLALWAAAGLFLVARGSPAIAAPEELS